jgi:hypothetical protein
MTLQSSGAISLLQIATEFGGSAPHSMSEYRGSGGTPATGAIDFADFYSTSAGPPSSGLIMHMEPSAYSSGSTWNDSAGTNNQMTKVGSPSYTSSSPKYFTTSNSNFWQVTTRPTGSYSAATFIAWVYRSASKTQGIFDIRYGNGTQFGMEVGYDGEEFGYFWNNNSSGTYTYQTNLNTPLNAWCMVGVGVNSSSAEFFMRTSSAESINTRTYTHSSQTIGSTSTIYYGGDPESSGRGWVGRLGHFYMYNRKISTAEFRDIYNLQKSYYGH